MEEVKVTSYCQITPKGVFLNGNKILSPEKEDPADFLKEVYRSLSGGYPRFFRMDNLSRLGFITADILLHKYPVHEKYSNEDIATVFSNNSSSLDTDLDFFKTIESEETYFPSPAVFVYTLPNIVTGEISIRYNLKGENLFFVEDEKNTDNISLHSRLLIENNNCQCCISGRIEIFKNKFESCIFIAERSDAEHPVLSADTLEQLFKNG